MYFKIFDCDCVVQWYKINRSAAIEFSNVSPQQQQFVWIIFFHVNYLCMSPLPRHCGDQDVDATLIQVTITNECATWRELLHEELSHVDKRLTASYINYERNAQHVIHAQKQQQNLQELAATLHQQTVARAVWVLCSVHRRSSTKMIQRSNRIGVKMTSNTSLQHAAPTANVQDTD